MDLYCNFLPLIYYMLCNIFVDNVVIIHQASYFVVADCLVVVLQVSFQVSYQVAGGMKTLTSCYVSGCALSMPMKPGQPVTVFVAASVSGVSSEEVTATGNTSKS